MHAGPVSGGGGGLLRPPHPRPPVPLREGAGFSPQWGGGLLPPAHEGALQTQVRHFVTRGTQKHVLGITSRLLQEALKNMNNFHTMRPNDDICNSAQKSLIKGQ